MEFKVNQILKTTNKCCGDYCGCSYVMVVTVGENIISVICTHCTLKTYYRREHLSLLVEVTPPPRDKNKPHKCMCDLSQIMTQGCSCNGV